MSSPAPAQTTQVQQTQLPQWVSDASQANYNLATDIANRPLQQYQGPTVASTSPLMQQAYDTISSSAGSTSPLYGQATGLYKQAGDTINSASPLYQQAQQYLTQAGNLQNQSTDYFNQAGNTYGQAGNIYSSTAGDLDPTKYLNPYTQEVQDRAVNEANLALKQQLTGIDDTAQKSGAFGGSRAAIQSGVAQGEGVRNIGDLVAQLRKQGFDTATQTAISDRAGKQAAAAGLLGVGSGQVGVGQGYLGAGAGLGSTASGFGNTAAGIIGQGTALGNTAAGLTNAATAKQAATTNDINALMAGGTSQQSQQQALIDAAMKQFYEARDYPIQGLNMRLAALGMSPYGKTETTSKTSTSEDKGPDWATLGLGGLKTLPALMQAAPALAALSDRNMKTDIEKLTDGDIPMYAYRYKGDPKTYPKMVGPMAQDVEKKFPEAVGRVGDARYIDYAKLKELLS